MTMVAVCSSSKFYGTAQVVAGDLVAAGYEVCTPRFDFNETQVEVGLERKRELTLEFLDKLRGADLLYVVAEGGYTGRSVCIEVGYASALRLPVYASELPVEGAVRALVRGVVRPGDLAEVVGGLIEQGAGCE